MVQFAILGPLELRDGDGAVAFASLRRELADPERPDLCAPRIAA